jgi:hypothetical protein
MRRIAFLFLGLCLTVATIGCKKEDVPPTTTDPAAPAGDADKDGDANATDDAAADPAEQ